MKIKNYFKDDHISKAPKLVKRRICALKSLQLKSIDIEAAFYKRVHDLEREFEKQFDALFLEVRNTKSGPWLSKKWDLSPTFINVAISAQEDRQWRARAVGRGGQTAAHSRTVRGRPEGGVAKIGIVTTVSIRC